MSLLVHYTLTSADDHDAQTRAMQALVEGLISEGVAGVQYSCFATDDPLRFVGVLETADAAAQEAFVSSDAFATYKRTVGPTFANPPQTTQISLIASTHR